MTFAEWMTRTSEAFEALAALVLALGIIWAVILGARAWRRSGRGPGYAVLRQSFGGVVLLALEILVAADLIRTVAVQPTLGNVAVLGLIVLIRTFLSFSLEIEIEGVPPWRRLAASGAATAARAARAAADSPARQRPAAGGEQARDEPDLPTAPPGPCRGHRPHA